VLTERTVYWPQEGRVPDVLALRREACAIRLALGLPAGRIFIGSEGDEETVQWECRFSGKDARATDLAARDASAEFKGVRKRMRDVIRDFRRCVLEHDEAPVGRLAARDIDGHSLVPREVTFKSAGLDLAGFLFLPPGEGPFPAMVINHGSSIEQGSQEVSAPGIAALLASWGVASLMPNRRGYGNSPGTPWRQEVSAPFGTKEYDDALALRLDGESNDVVAAGDFLAGLPEIDADHVGVMGSSFGGVVTLLAASKSDRFRCSVDFAGAAMNWDRTPGLRALMTNAAHRLARPACFLQAANDFSVRPTLEITAALEGTGKVFESHVFPGFGTTHMEGHLLFRGGIVIWGPRVRAFLERWL
jgi:dienelactone hydrolase